MKTSPQNQNVQIESIKLNNEPSPLIKHDFITPLRPYRVIQLDLVYRHKKVAKVEFMSLCRCRD